MEFVVLHAVIVQMILNGVAGVRIRGLIKSRDGPRQAERDTGLLLNRAKYSRIWSRHFAESLT